MHNELKVAMILTGCASLSEIGEEVLSISLHSPAH